MLDDALLGKIAFLYDEIIFEELIKEEDCH
jgi:hypothetical protein